MSTEQAGPAWVLSDDRKTITVTFPTHPPAVLRLDAASVDDLLRGVGTMRAHMLPEVTKEISPGTVQTTLDSAWKTEIEPMEGLPILMLRDMGFGWRYFALPKHEAAALGQSLLDMSKTPTPELGARN